MSYERMITEATGIKDAAAVAEIQAEMRANLSGLDHLDKRAFNRLAREAAGTCAALGAIAAANYAASLAKPMTFEEWVETRQEVENLGDHGIDAVEGPGFLYADGLYIELNDLPAESHPAGRYCLTIENYSRCSNDLADLEKVLWDWAQDMNGETA